MIVMPANSTGIRTGYMAGRYPGLMGHLLSPGAQRGPFDFMPYALDNGAFGHDDDWSESAWVELLNWAKLSGQRPLWALVPDVVGDKAGTLAKWAQYSPLVRSYGWPLAFAVQDGMIESDVPAEAKVIFVGGTTGWKWRTYRKWCLRFSHVHVGRVNTYRRLWDCYEAGAKSTDGTGWMRGNQVQYRGLLAYLEEASGRKNRIIQMEMSA